MKRIRLYCASALVSLLTLFSVPNVLQLGTLKEISTPYVGYYQCETLRIGGRDYAGDVNARLEVGTEEMTLIWKAPLIGEQRLSFPYEYDESAQSFFLTVPDGKGEKRVRMTYEKGELTLSENLSGKAFFARFSRK
ncbi:MAG: hypothetical protein IJF39_03760 [Clostridia bacterium]|nr:hypothetical protein [Clostridia bacterium]